MAAHRHRVNAGGGSLLLLVFLLLLLPLCSVAGSARDDADALVGRRLSDALRSLSNRGLRIVFSSETVTPSMRVVHEPPPGTLRQILDAILKPHSLDAEEGPGGVIQIVHAVPPRGKRSADSSLPLPRPNAVDALATYSERVNVTAPGLGSLPGHEPDRRLFAGEIQTLSGLTTGDPFRAVQALPGVVSAGDFHSEFSVRASPSRHVGVVIDGAAMPWVRHEVYGRHDIGSVALVNPDVIEQAALLAGTYPLRHPEHLGGELHLMLRDGSRTATQGSATVGGTYTALLAEGPIGSRADRVEARGSWLLAARQSHRDWPLRKQTRDGSVLGFTDAHARVVYDLWPGQQISVTWIGGRTGAEGPDAAAPGGLAHANTTVSQLNAVWRSAPGDRHVLTQRVSTSARDYRNKYPTGEDFIRGADRSAAYQAELVQSVLGGILETGGQIERSSASRLVPDVPESAVSAWRHSAYGSFARTFSSSSINSGIRATRGSAADAAAVSRWLLVEWRPWHDWTLTASTGAIAQLPTLEQALWSQTGSRLGPERATKLDVGIAREIGTTLRVRADFFGSRERDLLLWDSQGFGNTGFRSSHGVEITVARRRTSGLSGWIAYAFGHSRETDQLRRRTYWSDFDQRHAVNAFASYRVSDRTNVSLSLVSGSNFPVPAAAAEMEQAAALEHNSLRLPPYARLDARAQHRFDLKGQRLTAFVEVLNVLNRANRGRVAATPFDRGLTSFSEPLFPRLVTVGFRVDFGRP